ncbi:sugar ABC transporter substrate-binding protein [Treponema sp.]|uniref:ABC transporter substrate-binding protein n=1 Tax=Treponema sp. TaxID=166 RepID=UPI0025CEA146|nr:sugar ABC transporter substrate-binding protein [Treponema sp.]MBR4323430.1 sugar ABC transporter substrate-binding protein [Treponema sp.]
MKKILMALAGAAMCLSAAFSEELTLMIYAQPQEKAILDKVIARFEQTHKGTKVKFISSTQNEYGAKIQAQLAANNLPDVFYLGPGEVRQYVDNRKVLDLSPYVKSVSGVNFADLYESAVDTYRYDGKELGKGEAIWALPKDFGPFALAYNKTLFEKYKVPLPSKDTPYTWQEFIDVCEKLTRDNNGDGQNDVFGTGLNIHWAFIQFVWGNGADFLDSTHTKVTVSDPKFVEALQYWANMTLGNSQYPVAGLSKFRPVTPTATQAQSLDTYQRWIKGELAFFPAGPWDLAKFNDPEVIKFEYDLIPWPVHTSANQTATYRGGVGYAVAATSKNPQLAAELALYLSADEEANKMYSDMDLQIPNLKSLASRYTSKPGKPANRQEYINIISKTGRSWPSDYTYNSVWYDKFYMGIQRVLDGKLSAKDYCTKIQPQMQRELDKALQRARQSAARNKK